MFSLPINASNRNLVKCTLIVGALLQLPFFSARAAETPTTIDKKPGVPAVPAVPEGRVERSLITGKLPSSDIAKKSDDKVDELSVLYDPTLPRNRSRSEVEAVFDRNKGAIYADYVRALQSNAELKGKVVLEMTIHGSGEVVAAKIVSSALNDEQLERRLLSGVKLFKFEAGNFQTITLTKPIEFFPPLDQPKIPRMESPPPKPR